MGAPPLAPGNAARIVNAMRQLLEEVPAELAYPPQVHFKHRGIQPPAAMYVTQSEFLAVKTLSSVANPALTVSYRILGADGQVIYNQSALANLAAGSLNTQLFPLREGFLFDVCVSAFGSTLKRGQCFVTLSLQFGNASGQTPFDLLVSDYVTNTGPVGWPGGSIRESVESRGAVLSTASSVPAAGAEITFTVATATRMRVQSVFFTLTTAVAVANRIPGVIIDDGANVVFESTGNSTQAASTTANYIAASGIGFETNTVNAQTMPLPVDCIVGSGFRIRTNTLNLQAADQYTAANILGEQWVEL